MTNDLIEFYNKNKFNIERIPSDKKEILEIKNLTSFLSDSSCTIKQRIWHIFNSIFVRQKCVICGNDVKFNTKSNCYNLTCSKACKKTYDISTRSNKIKNTCIEKYGVDNPMKLVTSQEKIKNTFIEKYGVDNPSKLDFVKQKINDTNVQKFGEIRFSQTEEGKQKQRDTFIEKYGVDNPFKIKEIYEKGKTTSIEKYGAEYYSQTEEGRQKQRDTFIEKYGVDNPSKSESVIRKSIDTNTKLYFKEYYSQTNESKNNIRLLNENKFKERLISDGYYDQGYRIIKSLGNCDYLIYCPICKNNFVIHRSHIYYKRNKNDYNICTICNPLSKQYSFMEKQLLSYVRSIYNGEISENDRSIIKPYELDIYLPGLNLAIEFNGDYWHANPKIYDEENTRISRIRKKDNLKLNLCKSKNITLIIIWENDWLERRNVVERYIAKKITYV